MPPKYNAFLKKKCVLELAAYKDMAGFSNQTKIELFYARFFYRKLQFLGGSELWYKIGVELVIVFFSAQGVTCKKLLSACFCAAQLCKAFWFFCEFHRQIYFLYKRLI